MNILDDILTFLADILYMGNFFSEHRVLKILGITLVGAMLLLLLLHLCV